MKLLLDQNISFRITTKIQDLFPGSKQVRDLGLENSKDSFLWNYAKENNYCIIKVMRSAPKWDPAINPEAREDYYSNVIVRFELPDKVAQDDTFSSVEDMPQYPGGEVALDNYIKINMKYPEVAKTKKIEGTVLVRFIVRVDGKVEEPTVLKGVHPLLDAEAIRVVSTVSGWKAGSIEGNPVNVYSIIPVTFRIP